MNSLPKDPVMLMSTVNTLLRDKYSSLDELAKAYGISKTDIENDLKKIGYKYNSELNQFKYLDYAVRNANCTSSNESDCWLTLAYDDNNNPLKYVDLATCDNATADRCYNGEESKEYTEIAMRPVFGYTSHDDLTFKSMVIPASEQSYDIVLFINDDDTNQNADQDKTFSGNVFIEAVSGTEKITGKVNP